ncbi:MAG: hypothetical protein IIY94_03305 [Oscillospiraceae bacterium]|nr:hypothetical protein [Oscillospiraceae bacterium]
MGMTTATLHVRGIEKSLLAEAIGLGFVQRDNNPPWIDILTPGREDASNLEKLAKKLTKTRPEAAALLFCYFDDDLFACTLYQDGKKAAACYSNQSWAKLGKALDALFGDELAGKAFRHASRCTDLDEQVRLLEETVGTSLLDDPEFDSRTVSRTGETLRAIKARESALRKRKNQCVLTELPAVEWPQDWQAQLRLYQLMRPNWRDNKASGLLWGFGDSCYGIPNHPEYAVFVDAFGPEDHFLRCKADSVQLEVIRTPARIRTLVWQTPQGEPVCAYSEEMSEHGWIEGKTKTVLACLLPDGSPRWRFVPPANGELVEVVHSSADGSITLCARSCPWANKDAQLCQLDGKSGVPLRTVSVPCAEGLTELAWVESLQRYIYVANQNELVMLNKELEEVARWKDFRGSRYLNRKIVGSVLWEQDHNSRVLRRYDLGSCTMTETTPEVPTHVFTVLPDGRFLGVNEKHTRLTVFDPAGTVISQHSLKDRVTHVRCDGDRICILENRSIETYGFVCEELFEQTSFHVWQLDPI